MKKQYFFNVATKNTRFLFLFTILFLGYVQGFASEKNEDRTITFKSNLYTNNSNTHSVSSGFDTSEGQKSAGKFWKNVKESGKPIDRSVVVELYKKAGDFSVIHALLKSRVISSEDSKAIGSERAKMHNEALESVARSGKFGKKIGVNDFGSGEMTAKSDIDFTLYPGIDGVDGSQMTAAYKKFFKSLSGGIDPSVFDLVAHRYEATIPDWRQASSSSEFAARLRKGSRLLSSNSEAYFLEGAYINQIMARSVDPKRKTFTWIKDTKDGIKKDNVNVIESDLPFFFHPGSRERYAFGSAVGNWHFYHHTQDKVSQAKYLLRSINGSKATLGNQYVGLDFELMPPQMQLRLVDKLYGHMFKGLAAPAQKLKKQTLLATIQTAAKIRQLKSQGDTSLGVKAYQPLMDLERSTWPKSIPVDDATLLKVAKSHLERYWPALLVENNIRTSKNRLSDWLSPPIKIGHKFSTLDKNGKKTTINIDAEGIKRLQFSAFFELKDAISLMTQDQINRIKKANPKAARDIEILQGIYATETSNRALKNSVRKIDAPVTLNDRLNNFVDIETQVKHVIKKYDITIPQSIDIVSQHRIPQAVLNAGSAAIDTWNKGKIAEEWLQERAIDKFLIISGGEKYLPALYKYRGDVKTYNQSLANPNLLLAADYGTSLIKILDAYVVDGELSPAVKQVMLMEFLLRIPVLGSIINLTNNPIQAGSNIIFAQLIPGYGPANIAIQLAVEATKLAGHIVFVPLQRDKVLMAYQGYLEAEEAGVFLAGRKERQESPRPALLLPIAPDKDMPLSERRKKVYDYFFNDVRQTINGLTSFDYNEEYVAELFEDARNHPGDKKLKGFAERASQKFSQKEMEVLKVRIRQYVNQWSTATGVFSGYDEILSQTTAGLTEKQFIEKLESLLLKDYYTGKNLYYQEQINKEAEIRKNILMVAADIAIAGKSIDRKHSSSGQQRIYEKNAQMILADTLDNMPSVKPEIKIWAIPVIDRYALHDTDASPKATSLTSWATVSASEKEYPQPWSITWETDSDNKVSSVGDEFSMDLSKLTGTKQLNLTATAYDAEGKKIVRDTLRIPIESISSDSNESENNDSITKTESCKDKYSTELENIEKEIASIKEFSDGVQGKCAEIQKLLGEQQKKIDLEKKTISQIKTQMNEFLERMKNTEKTKEKLGEIDKKIEKLTVEITDLVSELGEFSLKVCEKTKTLNDYKIKDIEHEKTFQWIQTNKKEFKIYLKKIKERYKKIDSHKQTISTLMDDHKTIKIDEIDNIDKSITKMDTLAKELDTTVAKANQMLIDNLKDISVLYSRKQAVKKSIKNLGKECEEELKGEIKSLYEQLNGIKISKCSKDLEAKIKSLESSSESIKKESAALTKQMGENKKQYKEYTKNVEKIENLKKDREVTILLVDNYLERGKRYAVDGAFCVVLAEEIMKKVFIPNVIGMKFVDALSTLSRKGLNNITEGNVKQTLSKELEKKVFNQSPQTKKRVKKETKITLDHYASYGDTIESLIAQKKCPANTVKVWNESLKIVECVCQGPVFVWNKDQTKCLTHAEAELEEKNDALSKANCPREYPGSVNSWNSSTKKVDCICLGPVFVWNKSGTACITQAQAEEEERNNAMTQANCPREYPGSVNSWNSAKKRVDCICLGPTMVWNKAGNACITQEATALENINCSHIYGAEPGYYNGQAGCVCKSPLVPSKIKKACITRDEAALENANCKNGKEAVLDNGIVRCQCPQRTWWSERLYKCATYNEISQECSRSYPGTIPADNAVGCACPKGIKWLDHAHRCADSNYCSQTYPGSRPSNHSSGCTCNPGTKWNQNLRRCAPPQQPHIPHVSPENVKKGKCDNANRAGRDEPEQYVFNLGWISNFKLRYNTYSKKDRIIVTQGNTKIHDTGCVGKSKTVQLQKNPNNPQIRVTVQPNCENPKKGTRWNFTVICPK